ncbi:hypothetical protein [Salinigranum sp.]|uniref:hypothetical protein n=1 Tax=Salinigranum sp. TaxID=1966351 RepID=UPI00356256B9
MHRRTFVGVTAVGIAGFAGCTGGRSNTGEARAATPVPTGIPGPTATPDSQRGAGGQRETDSGADEPPEQEFASAQSLPDLTAEMVSVSGVGNASEAGYVTTKGGPVLFRVSANGEGMLAATFSLSVVGDGGIGQTTPIVAESFVEELDVVQGRVVRWLPPDEYKLSVRAGGARGDLEWEVTIEQPGLAQTGTAAPLTYEGEHVDVVGPLSLSGATRATLETFGTRYAQSGSALDSNHIVRFVDQRRGTPLIVINELDAGPQTYTNVFDGSRFDVGYLVVTGSRLPWRLTVEPV